MWKGQKQKPKQGQTGLNTGLSDRSDFYPRIIEMLLDSPDVARGVAVLSLMYPYHSRERNPGSIDGY